MVPAVPFAAAFHSCATAFQLQVHKDHLLIALEGRANDLFSALNEEALELTSRGAPGLGAKKGLAAAKGGGSSSSSTSGVGGGGAFAGWRLDQSVRDTTTRRHLDAVKRLGAWAESSGEEEQLDRFESA